jgi:hypothetical protein
MPKNEQSLVCNFMSLKPRSLPIRVPSDYVSVSFVRDACEIYRQSCIVDDQGIENGLPNHRSPRSRYVRIAKPPYNVIRETCYPKYG